MVLEDFLPYWMTQNDFYIALSTMAVFIAVVILGSGLSEKNKFKSKMDYINKRRDELKNEIKERDSNNDDNKQQKFVTKTVKRLNLIPEKQFEYIQTMLMRAGLRSKFSIYAYAFAQFICPFVCIAICLFLIDYNKFRLDLDNLPQNVSFEVLAPFIAAIIGVYLPRIYVANIKEKRYKAIHRGLADSIDLMVIFTESGLTVSHAFERVAQKLSLVYPEIAEEFGLTAIELNFMPSHKDAYLNLADRVDMKEIRGLAQVLIQSEKYGTPVSQALNIIAKETRTEIKLRAEQKAAQLPAMMTVPMIIFILPCLFVIVVSPAILKLMITRDAS